MKMVPEPFQNGKPPFDKNGPRTKTEAFTLSPENDSGTVKLFWVCSKTGGGGDT